MDIKEFLDNVCKQIKSEPIKKEIFEELNIHLQESKKNYVNKGLSSHEAEENAVKQMGSAIEIGKTLNKIHKPKLDWKLLLLIFILIFVGIIMCMFELTNNDYIYFKNQLLYIFIGTTLATILYFVDYKKIKKFSSIIYIIASFLMLLPLLGLSFELSGTDFIRIYSIVFSPCLIAIPLYIIAFAGYIDDYNKLNILKFVLGNNTISINKNKIKIVILSLFSLMLTILLPSLVNTILLLISYLVILSVKIVNDNSDYKKKLFKLYSTIPIFLFIIICVAFTNPNIMQDLQKSTINRDKILQNSQLIGTKDEEFFINEDELIGQSKYTFIYLLGRTGIIVAGATVIIVVLVALRLIFDSIKIKEPYGKLLLVGLTTLYILESIISIVLNTLGNFVIDINLPFVTYGGVYFILNIITFSLILSIYRRKDFNTYSKFSTVESNTKIIK